MSLQRVSGLLQRIKHPRDLAGLSVAELNKLAQEIRGVLIRDVRRFGGHLGPNAGVVELTIALHRVFESPQDPIVFDVGHQSYAHKLLTGRQDLSTLRQRGGLSGYPSRDESVHDVLESSHAASALSWGVGLAHSYMLQGQSDRTVVVVLGDGSLTGGTTWEAFNNIGPELANLVVILNDNEVSYAPTVGAIADRLAALRQHHTSVSADEPSHNIFADFNLTYYGPVDGHDITQVEQLFGQARNAPGPAVVHVITEKARGVPLSDSERDEYAHTVSAGTKTGSETTPSQAVTGRRPRWTKVFEAELCRHAAHRANVVALSAAMVRSTGLTAMAERFPDRVFDVGIAEQHAVTTAAGMAYAGLHPVVAIYSTFLTRAVDQLIMDVALHRAPVTFVLDRAGVTGPDGPSHHGQWDLSLLSTVPGMRIATPRDATALQQALTEALDWTTGPTAVRFPTGQVPPRVEPVYNYDDGTELLYTSVAPTANGAELGDIFVCVIGPFAQQAITAAHRVAQRGITVSVVAPRWAHPVPASVVTAARRHRAVLTLEDGIRTSGIGSRIAQALLTSDTPPGRNLPVRCLGLPPGFIEHGTREELLAQFGLTANGVETAMLELSDQFG